MTLNRTAITRGRPAAAAGAGSDPVMAERARIRGILTAPEAEQARELAEHLALETDTDVCTARALLRKAASESMASLDSDAIYGSRQREAGHGNRE